MMLRSGVMNVVLFAGMLMLTSGCTKEHDRAVPAAPAVVKGLVVDTVHVQDVSERLEMVGTVKAVNSSVIAARVAGTVTALMVKEGDRVRKGQVLGSIEAVETLASAAAAQAGVEEARRALDEALSRRKLADATFQRYSRLFSEQAVTRQEYETRQSEQEVAAQGVSRAESRLVQARESARAAVTVAAYTKMIAPLAGMITNKAIDRGATVFPGMPLMTVEGEGGFLLEVQAPETLKGRISTGKAIEVVMDGMTAPETGRVVEIVPAIDPASRTFTVKVAVAGKGLRSGSYGKVFVPVGSVKGIVVPKKALVERGALNLVWVVDQQNIIRMRLVKAGRQIGEQIEILAGLSDGERIVVSGVEKASDGGKVE
ncbi:MAG: efflux RND transporter periplasmic adaptor subunit [Geobacter sp.]|nr:efflux RND transporter periplasmic adaptor subunit [Geobacter sp.]